MQRPSERTIILLVGAVQFVNILDFMIVMPLGPDFGRALQIPNAMLGYVGGGYTAAAALAGIGTALFLERFDRRSALAVAMFGLVVGTLAGSFATGLRSLVAARVVAGMFGGPATSLAFSIIADTIPPERRGKAMGAVMGAFSVASILGVPAGLELARVGGWRLPFIAVAALGVVIAGGAVFLLPPMRGHLRGGRPPIGLEPLLRLVRQPLVLTSYTMTAMVMMAGFMLLPNFSAYIQSNLHYPRIQLGRLYLIGGLVSFFSLRLVGFLVDRYGSFRVGTLGAVLLLTVTYLFLIGYQPGYSVPLLFTSFMVAMSFRNVSYNTLASKVPSPRERASFMSLQSAVQHAASSLGAFFGARMLTELPDGSLVGLGGVARYSMTLTALLPALLFVVERRVRRRAATAA